jgi:hypothetical protein
MKPNQAVITVSATHHYGALRFEPVTQDRRLYYRLTLNGKGTGSLTSERIALETIDYWNRRGWINR